MLQNKKKPFDPATGAAEAEIAADSAPLGGLEATEPSAMNLDAPTASPAPGAEAGPATAEDEEDERAQRKERIEALRKVNRPNMCSSRPALYASELPQICLSIDLLGCAIRPYSGGRR